MVMMMVRQWWWIGEGAEWLGDDGSNDGDGDGDDDDDDDNDSNGDDDGDDDYYDRDDSSGDDDGDGVSLCVWRCVQLWESAVLSLFLFWLHFTCTNVRRWVGVSLGGVW